jgi:hypothetical protein
MNCKPLNTNNGLPAPLPLGEAGVRVRRIAPNVTEIIEA